LPSSRPTSLHPTGASAARLDRHRSGRVALLLGHTFLALPCATLLLTAIAFSLGGRISPAIVPAAAGAGLLYSVYLARQLGLAQPVRAGLLAQATCLALLALSAALSATVPDSSADGQVYHQYAVYQLGRGWNPFFHTDIDSLWCRHYSKGPWLYAAALYALSGLLETGKAFNLLLVAASGLVVAGALTFGGLLSHRRAAILGVLAAGNPVAICQSMTFYVDGQLASLFTALAGALLLAVARPGRLTCGLLAPSILLLVNAKFTGLVYAIVLLCVAAGALWWRYRSRPLLRGFAGPVSTALALGVLLVGFNPYVTNTIERGHPLYPLAGVERHPIPGVEKFEVLAQHRPPSIATAGNRLGRLAYSLAAAADFAMVPNAQGVRERVTRRKIPFTTSATELRFYGNADVRLAGWGPLFSGILLLTAAALAYLWRSRRVARWFLGISSGAVLGTVLLNSECWWARYVPQLWLLPLVALGALLALRAPPRGIRSLAGLLLVASALNTALLAYALASCVTEERRDVERFLSQLRATASEVVLSGWIAPQVRLQERGVRVRRVTSRDRLPCADPQVVPWTEGETYYCISQPTPVLQPAAPGPAPTSGR
jgi:hypothetical protein